MMIPWQRAAIAGVALLVAAMIPVITQDQYVLRVPSDRCFVRGHGSHL